MINVFDACMHGERVNDLSLVFQSISLVTVRSSLKSLLILFVLGVRMHTEEKFRVSNKTYRQSCISIGHLLKGFNHFLFIFQ